MSNFVYGYVETLNRPSAIENIEQIVANQPLGLITGSVDSLYNFPPNLLPHGSNIIVFSICDSKQHNTASVLLDSLNYVADLSSGLPREAKKRRELLMSLISRIFNLEQVEKLCVALTEVEEIESIAALSLEKLKDVTINNYEGPPNVLYIVEKP